MVSVPADEIFGGIKAKWPQIRTVATLDWEVFPADLPLNVWVDEYADYGSSPDYRTPTAKEKLRQSWLASGADSKTGPHSFWWCTCTVFVSEGIAGLPGWCGLADWCIGPSDPRALNTFVERPAIEGRLLYWLTALHAVDGMLCKRHCLKLPQRLTK